MIKAPIYTIKGAKTGELTLPKEVFEAKVNLKLLAQAIHVLTDRKHSGLRKTQTRAEVNRTGKKLYKQKGTGGARHGSRRANLFVGGGVALGPRPVRRILTLPSALKSKSKTYAFSVKAGEKQVVVLRGLSKLSKTKEAAGFLGKLVKDVFTQIPRQKARFTFLLSESAAGARRFLRNLKNVNAIPYKDASALDVYRGGILVLDEDIFAGKKQAAGKKKGVKKTSA
jgi:large subunit ribosomal protein L4